MYFVRDGDPGENKAICDLVNSGSDPGRLLKAAFSFYVRSLEDSLTAKYDFLEVGSGLFQGMRLSKEVLASQLLPKVTGTYEKEVQDCIKEFSGTFDKFVDIGCAEGFYVAGISRWLKIPSLGIDIDPRSEGAVFYAAQVNQVSDYVSFSKNIDEVRDFLEGSVLCLVDVDGSEMEVLRSLDYLCNSATSLSFVRLLVESDFSVNGVNNTPEIVEFLSSSGWNVDRILRQNPANRFEPSLSELSFLDQVARGMEGRPGGQSWIVASKSCA